MEETKSTGPSPDESGGAPVSDDLESVKGKGFPGGGIPQEEEIDLNAMFPKEDQDLNELFPEKELKTLLHKVHKSRKDLAKINDRFVDDTENVIPKNNPDSDPA